MTVKIYNITTPVPITNDFTHMNAIAGVAAAALVDAGWNIVSDNVGSPTLLRAIVLGFPGGSYMIRIRSYFTVTAGHHYLEVLSLDGTTVIATWYTGYKDGYASPLTGGAITVIKGAGCCVMTIQSLVPGGSGGMQPSCLGYLKFSDNNYYLWGKVLTGGVNGGLLDNTTNICHDNATSIYYPVYLNGAYPLIPWIPNPDGAITVWNINPISVYSIKPNNFTDLAFYQDDKGNNYLKYGNLMISD